MIKRVIQFGSATVLSLSLFVSVAMAAPTITNTGKGSLNVVATGNVNVCKNINKNSTTVFNNNVQLGKSGKVKVKGNTTSSGDATSGDVTQNNTTTVNVTAPEPVTGDCAAASSTCPDGSINTTGDKSVNLVLCGNVNVQKTVTVNSLFVGNSSFQAGKSGSVTVSGNTTTGDATSGGVSNTNTTTVTVGS